MALEITKGTAADVDALARLYEDLIAHLNRHTNYPGWIAGIYPTREDAEAGVLENCLYVARMDGRIVGTMMLRNRPEPGYAKADWRIRLDDGEVLVVYTLAVHPDYLHRGIGKALLAFAVDRAGQTHMKAVRLDVYEVNEPAIRMYERAGFEYIGTVDLGYGKYGLNGFALYQLLM